MTDSQTQAPSPNTPSHWAPIETVFSPQHCANFMFMNQVGEGSVTIYLYKHRHTRRYLNLDASGRAYQFAPNPTDRGASYRSIPLGDAIAHALT